MCIHRFLLSGADVISTATYQASVEGFMDHLNVSSEGAKELIMSGVQLAKEAVESFVPGTNPNTAVQSGLWLYRQVLGVFFADIQH